MSLLHIYANLITTWLKRARGAGLAEMVPKRAPPKAPFSASFSQEQRLLV